MATRGRKPTPNVIKLVTGNPGRRPISEPSNLAPAPDGPLKKPPKISPRASELWDEVVERAWWLKPIDAYALHLWCELQAQFERSRGRMVAARIAQLRSAGSELGLQFISRSRAGVDGGNDGKEKDPAAKYFG